MYAKVYFGSMATISATDARASLPALLDRVAAGDEVTITRHGRPVAVLVRPDALRARRAGAAWAAAEVVRERLAEGRTRSLSVGTGIDPDRAEDLVADVRAGRAG
jgi:prevent-host-death family protein